MRSKKILFVLIPLIIIVLALGGGFAYLMLNSTPEKIFTTSINRVFDALKTEKEDMATLKGKVSLTGSIESDDEDMQAINDVLETSSILVNMAVDTEKMIINENIEVVYDDESILDATILLQEEKGYVYLPNFLDRYIEIPEEELNYSEIEEALNNVKTLDINLLLDAVQTEFLNLLSSQEFKQEKNGKIKASIIDLSQEQFIMLCRDLCIALKQNQNFNNALEDYKEYVIDAIDDVIAELTDYEGEENSRIIISIYTEGLFNKFRGFGIELKTDEDIVAGILFASSEVSYEFSMYSIYDGEKEETFKIRIDDRKENKNKGVATITITAEEEEFIVLYSYEKIDNQLAFKVTTEIVEYPLEIEGNLLKEGNRYKGNLVYSMDIEEYGTANLNCAYDFTYNVDVKKTDIEDSVLIDELTEEDKEEIMTNIENSKLYEILGQYLDNPNEFDDSANNLIQSEQKNFVTYGDYVINYNVPNGFELSTSFDYAKNYSYFNDEDINFIQVKIGNNIDIYLSELENDIKLTNDYYHDQEISEILNYEINGKIYKYRTITYSSEDTSYVNLYFAYELDSENTYIVQVESENGNISLDDIDMFLDITIE